jgi:hypothetical protein
VKKFIGNYLLKIPLQFFGITEVKYKHGVFWWRDIISLGRGLVDDWFKANVRCRVGDGKNIGFWKFKWYGNQPFCELFPNLFVKESYKEVPIAERLVVNGVEPSCRW